MDKSFLKEHQKKRIARYNTTSESAELTKAYYPCALGEPLNRLHSQHSSACSSSAEYDDELGTDKLPKPAL